jgi:hypothetical protein
VGIRFPAALVAQATLIDVAAYFNLAEHHAQPRSH